MQGVRGLTVERAVVLGFKAPKTDRSKAWTTIWYNMKYQNTYY